MIQRYYPYIFDPEAVREYIWACVLQVLPVLLGGHNMHTVAIAEDRQSKGCLAILILESV